MAHAHMKRHFVGANARNMTATHDEMNVTQLCATSF